MSGATGERTGPHYTYQGPRSNGSAGALIIRKQSGSRGLPDQAFSRRA